MSKYTAYILRSRPFLKYYIGSCSNLDKRLAQHNKGVVRATKYGVPWEVVHVEEYDTRQEAYKREKQIKSYKGGEAFKKLLR